MLKVVIVDDEAIIIEGLQILIDWMELGLKIAGWAYDGEEGLELIKQLQPEIVITDIRMPMLNGLELIDQARAAVPECKIFILSGFNEFEYAKQAVEKGAFCYLLKPVPKEELTAKLLKAKNIIEAERRATSHLNQLQLTAKEKLLKDVINGKLQTVSEIKQVWEWLDLGETTGFFVMAVFRPDASQKPDADFPWRSSWEWATGNHLEFLSRKISDGIFFSYDVDTLTVILRFPAELQSKKNRFRLIAEIRESLFQSYGVSFSAGASSCFQSVTALPTAFAQAMTALEQKLLNDSNVTVPSEALPISARDQMAAKIKNYIDAHYADISREAIARKFFLNPSYVSQLFKQATGMVITEYLANVRIEQAKKLLLTGLKIQDIAERVGYQSGQYFGKIFEKYTGVSPHEFKKNYGR